MAPHDVERERDEVMGAPSWLSLGFLGPGPGLAFGTSQSAFGTPGAGGSFGFADPDSRLGYAYVMNNMDYYMIDDPREKVLRDSVHSSIRRLSGCSEARLEPRSNSCVEIAVGDPFELREEPSIDGMCVSEVAPTSMRRALEGWAPAASASRDLAASAAPRSTAACRPLRSSGRRG